MTAKNGYNNEAYLSEVMIFTSTTAYIGSKLDL